MDYAKELKAKRELLDETQVEAAVWMQVSHQAVALIEQGGQPGRKVRRAIERYLARTVRKVRVIRGGGQ